MLLNTAKSYFEHRCWWWPIGMRKFKYFSPLKPDSLNRQMVRKISRMSFSMLLKMMSIFFFFCFVKLEWNFVHPERDSLNRNHKRIKRKLRSWKRMDNCWTIIGKKLLREESSIEILPSRSVSIVRKKIDFKQIDTSCLSTRLYHKSPLFTQRNSK